MTEHTRISADGEAIIPKEVCERLEWRPGTELEIEERAGKLVVQLKPAMRERITLEEFDRRVPPHEGPPVTLEDMERGIDQAMAERWARKEANSR